MKRQLVKERRALEDLTDQVDYYVERELFAVADEFLSAFENFCALVIEQPEMAHHFEAESPRLREMGLRVWPLGHRYPHLVFYYLTDSEIRIYAVLHGHMDLGDALED